MCVVQLVEAQRQGGPLPLFALGFRPFFLLAGAFAALSVPVWLLVYLGIFEPMSHFAPSVWHGHEMIFGFTIAVIAGFLLTAASNWTGRRIAAGWPLLGLVVLWLAGRCAIVLGSSVPTWLGISLEVAFLPVLAVILAIPLLRTGNRRNVVFPLILLFLAGINLAIHLAELDMIDWDASRGLILAIDLVLLMIGVLGGRVIPSFTKNALPQARVNPCPRANVLALLSLGVLLVVDATSYTEELVGPVALTAGILNALRMRGWGSLSTWRHPILWILHVGYGWLVVGLVLRGMAGLFDLVPTDAGIHALTLGAIGSMTIGMMSRVALGHTGRSIKAAPAIVVAYWLLSLGALLRIAFPMLASDGAISFALVGSGIAWSLAFALFTLAYFPVLTRPRIDGRAG